MKKSQNPEVTVFLPDTHAPYLDSRAFNLAVSVFSEIAPRRLVILGDFADCAAISSHSKDPVRLVRFKQEIEVVNEKLDQLDFVEFVDKHYVMGNHEHRLQRYLQDRAPELSDLEGLTVSDLLKLPSRGYEVTPYRSTLQLGHFSITHDVERASGPLGAKRAREVFESNAIIGHVHAMSVFYSGSAKGKTRVGASFGWLGDKKKIDYMHSSSVHRHWTLGFGLGYTVNGVMHIQAVPIIDYKCVVNGKVYEG